MKMTNACNVLKVIGLNDSSSVKDCYLGTLKLIYGEFPRGYVEPHVLLFLLYDNRNERGQQFFLYRLPPDATCFFTIDWESTGCSAQLCSLFSLLHLCFASYPSIFLDEYAFALAYEEFERWRKQQ